MLISRINRSKLSVMTITEDERAAADLLILSAAISVITRVSSSACLGWSELARVRLE
jgi:hypothetical protein